MPRIQNIDRLQNTCKDVDMLELFSGCGQLTECCSVDLNDGWKVKAILLTAGVDRGPLFSYKEMKE